MFDISFGELLIIGAVTLIVVGPERMPKVARTAGALFGRLQRFVANVKADLQHEMQMSELAKLEAELREEGEEIKNSIYQPLADAAAILAEGAQMPPAAIEVDETHKSPTAIATDETQEPPTAIAVDETQEQQTAIETDEAQEPPSIVSATAPNSAYRDRR